MTSADVSTKNVDDAIITHRNPFAKAIVGGAWDEIVDVESLNQEISDLVVSLLKSSFGEKRARSMLVMGPPGIGKSHILARLRKLAKSERFLFVQVRPISDPTAIMSHIYRETFVSLRKKEPNERFSPMEEVLGKIMSSCFINLLWEKEKQASLSKEVKKFLEKIKKDPMAIYKYFEAQKAKRSSSLQKTVDLTIEYIEDQYPEIHPLFIKVLAATLDTQKKRTAMRWLQGDELPEEDLSLLQVAKTMDDENLAFRVLSSVFRLTDRPVLLCFDQMESILDRFHDPFVLNAFFDVLVQLYNDTPNMCILLMCQTHTWRESIANEIQKSAQDRIEERKTLKTPNMDQVLELVKLRLHQVYVNVSPPYPTYPFPHDYLENMASSYGYNPRHIIRTLADEFRKMQEEERVFVPQWQEPVVTPLEPAKLEVFLEKQLSKLVENFHQSLVDNPLKSRENFLEAIFFDIFNIILQENRQLGQWQVKSIHPRRRTGEPDFIVELGAPGQDLLNCGVEITNTENGRSFWGIMNRFDKAIGGNRMDRWFVIRDDELFPIPSTWKKTNQLLESLSGSGKLITIDFESNSILQACKELIDAASAGDLSAGDHVVSRDEAVSYIMEQVVPEINTIKELFEIPAIEEPGIITEPPPEPPPGDEFDILQERILTLLRSRPVLNVSKCVDDFQVDSEHLHKAIIQLKSLEKVVVLKEEPGQLIISKKTEGTMFG